MPCRSRSETVQKIFIGAYLNYLNYLKAAKINPKGFVIKPSVKCYLSGTALSGRYIALEYQYKNQHYDFTDTLALNNSRYEKQYPMHREINSLSFKYGNVRQYGNHFILEWHAGLGLRYIKSVSGLSAVESNAILMGQDGNCPIQYDFIRLSGKRFYPNFMLGVKVGYRLL